MTVNVEIENRISKCRKILDTDPNSQIFAALAEAHRKRGDLELAFKVCQVGLRVHPTYGAAHLVMAKINLDRGLYDWAEAEVVKARQADGNNRTVELLLAEICIYKGEYQKAIKLLKKLASVDPFNDHVRRLLEIAQKIPVEQEQLVGNSVARSFEPTVIQGSATMTAPVPEPAVARQPVMLSVLAMLRQTLEIEEVMGAMFINLEGLVIESQWRSELDVTICGAAMAEVNKQLNQELMEASFGSIDAVLIEAKSEVFYLIHEKNGMYLVVTAADVNLGTLRMKMAGLIQRVEVN